MENNYANPKQVPIQIAFDNMCKYHFGDNYGAREIFNLVNDDILRRREVEWNTLTNGQFSYNILTKVKEPKIHKKTSIQEEKTVLVPLTFEDDFF